MSWPTTPPAWTLPWAIWRFRYPTPRPPRTDGGPKEIPAWAFGFLRWAAWRRKGAIPPRPTSTAKAPIPTRIPQAYWNVLKQLNIAVPIEPPPPPPPPANPIPANSWKLPYPVLFTAWGWLTDSDWRDTDAGLKRAAEAGVRTILLQVGMFPASVPDRCRAFGMKVAIWGEPGGNDAMALDQADAVGYVPQIEGIYQYRNTIANLEHGVGAGLSLSTVTTLSGLETFIRRPNGTSEGESTTVEVEELASFGLTHAMVECYRGDMSPIDVSDFMWSAKHRGLHYANPTIGLAGRAGVSINGTYRPDIDAYGRQIAIYLAEPMRTIDWTELKAL